MSVVFITWLCFQIWVPPLERPTILNEVLLAVLGAWITNISYGVQKRNERVESAKDDARDKKDSDRDDRDAARDAAEDVRVENKVRAELERQQRGKHSREPAD
jgi:hypothetical protein